MNTARTGVVAAVLTAAGALWAGAAAAQGDDVIVIEERIVEPERAIEPVDEEFSRQMQEAEKQLAAAARRVAELSSERLERYGDGRQFVYDLNERPRLGVNIDADDDGDAVDGVSVASVTPGSAAEDAGLRAGDVITAVNGESLAADSQKAANKRLLDFMRGVEEGDTLSVTYRRDDRSETVDVEPRPVRSNVLVWAPDGRNFTMPRPPEVVPAPMVVDRLRYAFGGWAGAWGDMEVVELTAGLGRYFGTDEGLLVISAPKSNDLKLEEGDVIQSIDGRKPGSVDHCMRILASYQPGESLELKIMRDQRPETLRVAIPKRPETHTSRAAPAPAAAPAPPQARDTS